MQNTKTALVHASVIGLMVATVFVTAVTIAADLYLPIKNWLAATHGHHWVGKGIWTVALFIGATCLMVPFVKKSGYALPSATVRRAGNLALLAAVLITLFFVYEYVNH